MKINVMLRKCKSLSNWQLGRSSSYSSLSTRKRYVISSKYLNHPLMNALINKSKQKGSDDSSENVLVVNCEIVLFDHLLWMLEKADPMLTADSLEELADLYVI
ncbi:hypothetical protein PIB30_015007 [Stylosanthes scabra]|uniref:Small auxin up regulated protein n=1 Tax=Stylosanthes scabra TaxID=79078 RepID=A0ABU6Y5P0_9FABA|nr:hypothetical protein [Stylosanthes scabra]